MLSNKRKLKKPTKEVRLERFREQNRNRLVKNAAPPPLPKLGVMAGGVVDPNYLAIVAQVKADMVEKADEDMPLERGTYEEVVTDAKRCAARLNRTILVGDIKSETDLPDEDGYTEFHMLEIELLCPHGNGTDSWYYTKVDMAGGGEPFKEPQDGLWEHSETETDLEPFDCGCRGVT